MHSIVENLLNLVFMKKSCLQEQNDTTDVLRLIFFTFLFPFYPLFKLFYFRVCLLHLVRFRLSRSHLKSPKFPKKPEVFPENSSFLNIRHFSAMQVFFHALNAENTYDACVSTINCVRSIHCLL